MHHVMINCVGPLPFVLNDVDSNNVVTSFPVTFSFQVKNGVQCETGTKCLLVIFVV